MKILENNFGIIEDIESDKLMFNGSCYVISDPGEKNSGETGIRNKVKKLSFDYAINKLVNDYIKNEQSISPEIRSDEIENFFAERTNRLLDVILMPDSGIRGKDKVLLSDNSILFIGITGNIKIGFYINKTLAKIILMGGQLDDRT